MPEIHAIILTFNEEQHIARCIASLKGHCTSVTVIDSESTDRTVEICEALGAKVLSNPWVNHAIQLNFGIECLAEKSGWLLRIDADEIFSGPENLTLSEFVETQLDSVHGVLVNRQIHFMGKRIKHGAIEPSWQLRLWKNGFGRCENRWMDEHMKVSGEIVKSKFNLADINLNSLTWWTDKHNDYASREAIEVLNLSHKFLQSNKDEDKNSNLQSKLRRMLKEKLYSRFPKGVRPIFYFLYRYIVRLGFLDGKPGFYFHLLQGLWYRTLVDVKVEEIELHAAQNNCSIVEAILERTGLDALKR